MFSGLANYLFGSTNSDTDNNCTDDNNKKQLNQVEDTSHHHHNRNSVDDLKFLSIEAEDDDWLIVDKEEEEESLPRTDSEEELPFVKIKKSPKTQRPRNYHNLQSYNRNNHQQQQQLQPGTSGNIRGGSGGQYVHLTNPNHQQHRQNDGISQPLYVVPSNALAIVGNVHHMEESWFLTPPPCFTSTGPVNMETSPFENLLIEHPSMSVYHSIRSAQEAAESFVNLDLGIEGSQLTPVEQRSPVRTVQPVHRNNNRVGHLTNQQVKENLLLRNAQKVHMKKERQNNCRGAIKRANKARDTNSSKNGRLRRSDQQHCKIISGANNNRKC